MGKIVSSVIEQSLLAAEELLGVTIVVRDLTGFFCDADGASLLSISRNSHKRIPACAIGFTPACIQHCRHDVNERGVRERKPFVTHCWKGLQEVVAPLMLNGHYIGCLFAGTYRPAKRKNTTSPLSRKMLKEYEGLKILKRDKATQLGHFLNTFGKGLIQMVNEMHRKREGEPGRRGRIRRFLRLRGCEDLRLADLATELHLSSSQASRVVKMLFGTPFQLLLQAERIGRARILLITTSFSVGEIARQVGMRNEYHFNRVFKANTGLPPGKYRQHNRAE